MDRCLNGPLGKKKKWQTDAIFYRRLPALFFRYAEQVSDDEIEHD